jgi:hypothetical protein
MAEKAAAVYHSLPAAERDSLFIFCRGYFSAGALNYYARETGLPEVYSDNASFLFWLPDDFHFRHLLLVAHHIPDKDDIVFQQFGKMTVRDSLVMPLFRENGMHFILFENGNDSLRAIVNKGIAFKKKEFTR